MKFQAKSQVHLLNGTPLKIKGRDALLGEILFEICKKAAVQDPDTRRQLFVDEIPTSFRVYVFS